MKKFIKVVLVTLLTLGLVACGPKTEDDSINVAIIKLVDHASLDEIANSIGAELEKIAKEEGKTINYRITSGQADESTIIEQVNVALGNKVDAIIPIATLTAQIAAKEAEESKTPVIFAAISDPEGAELTGIDYVTGTSDALNTEVIMDMIFEAKPDTKKVGLLYSLSEINSQSPIKEAKAYLDSKNIEYIEKNGSKNDEVLNAASALIASGVDVIFTPTDNDIMTCELAIAPDFIEAGILHFAGADSFVRNGAFATCGVDYTKLGQKTARLAYEAITNGMADMKDYYLMDDGIVTVNTETADAIGIDYSCLSKFGTLNTVITTED